MKLRLCPLEHRIVHENYANITYTNTLGLAFVGVKYKFQFWHDQDLVLVDKTENFFYSEWTKEIYL